MTDSAMRYDISLTRAMTELDLFGKTFGASSFWTWKVLAKLVDGLPLTELREVELYRQCTGRSAPPNRRERRLLRRFIILCGRRGGKDRFESALAVWRAALCCDWRKYLSAGETAVVILLGRDKRQASILRRYCHGLLQVPLLRREVVRETTEVIEFRNGGVLEIASNDASLVRGRSAVAVLGSECCHWRTSEYSASSDEEVVVGAEPSMGMCPDGGLLMLGSSVGRRGGYMYRQYKRLHGNDDPELQDICWFAPSRIMNPRLPQRVVDHALSDDPARARAEYLSEWRDDLGTWCPVDVIEARTERGLYELPPQPGFQYFAYTDAAGGTGSDSFGLAVAHRMYDENSTALLDLVRERRPPFVPREVIAEYAAILKSYGIFEVEGDGFAGGFHASEWQRHGITFKPCERSTSENYLFLLPMLLNGRVKLIDNAVLRAQLASLERRVIGDRESVTHPSVASAHDDVACAAAGALVAAGSLLGYDTSLRWVDGIGIGETTPEDSRASWERFRLRMYMHRVLPGMPL